MFVVFCGDLFLLVDARGVGFQTGWFVTVGLGPFGLPFSTGGEEMLIHS